MYAVTLYAWLATCRGLRDEPIPARERAALSIVFGVLPLAIANNYLTPLVGSVWSAAVLLAGPVCHVLAIVARKQLRPTFHELRPKAWQDLAAAGLSVALILLIAFKLFFWRFLATYGVLYPDLPWHIGRAAEQAFQSRRIRGEPRPARQPDFRPRSDRAARRRGYLGTNDREQVSI